MDFKNENKSKDDRPSQEELSLRDTHGDVDAEYVHIIWSPITTSDDEHGEAQEDQDQAEQLHYNDTWTDQEGQLIESACQYLNNTLQEPLQINVDDIISRVIASINDRQAPENGFSVRLGDGLHVPRPGRTLITSLQFPSEGHDYLVLLVFTLDP